ncbi:MAG: hypothetical protein ACJAUC_001956 [Planctomycetota bacterium]
MSPAVSSLRELGLRELGPRELGPRLKGPRLLGPRLLGRAALLLVALSLGSCTFLADEFTWLNRAGPVAEPQDLPPSPILDRG